MRLFAVDGASEGLGELLSALREAEPEAVLTGFSSADAALNAAEDRDTRPDAVFTEVRTPELDGLELAARLRKAAPECKVVFVTAHPEYALEAFRLHARGYVLKPATPERLREELDELLPRRPAREAEMLTARCFGAFEVFWRDAPLRFSRKKSKELLAYLIGRQGEWCSTEEIVSALWEDNEGSDPKHYLRVLTMDLSNTLEQIGMQRVLRRRRGFLAVDRDAVNCDYYRFLAGEKEAMDAFRGQYMALYSWGEITLGFLYFKSLEQNHFAEGYGEL